MTMAATDDKTYTQMLKLVRYATRNADEAATKRDAAIREAHRAGVSLRDIAVEGGISHMSVKRIIERQPE